jgi:4-diphosphocytidyl-2-C-methyl-D-erythritol kinase
VPTIVVIKCFAKINLYLDVICKRPDGYHNIETVFQTISLCDILRLKLLPSGIEVVCDDPAVPDDESNLACRAFLEMKKATGFDGGVRIEIEKSIPPGSGLGGGSSNAAAVLAAMNKMLRAGLSEKQLHEIAHDLGADVPFFLTGGLAAAWGIGDRTVSLSPLQESFVVVAIPHNLSVSTADAYSMLQAPACADYRPEGISGCTDGLKSCVDALRTGKPLSEIATSEKILYNSLEGPIFSRHAEIARLKNLMLEAGAKGALMTGSGSAVYGLADSEADAGRIKTAVERMSSCVCLTAGTLDQGMEWVNSH